MKCYSCNGLFHVICGSAGNDDKVATKTTILHMKQTSTKDNFKFYCDRCLTEMEIQKANTDGKRLDMLEKKMSGIDKQLGEMMKILSTKNNSVVAATKKEQTPVAAGSIWLDKERLAKVKAPEPKAVLVISNPTDPKEKEETQEIVEKVVVDNAIALAESHTNKEGNLVLVCQSQQARDDLRDLVRATGEEIIMDTPKTRQKSITLVGLQRAYNNEEVIKMLITQNEFIKTFTIQNDISDHLKIHIIKPLRNKPTTFQVFASVSPTLRDGLRRNKDKIVIGLTVCKVYDRKQTGRCNNCQNYGHFAKSCPTPAISYCGKCSETHRTDQCSSEVRKCINCVRNHEAESDHPVFYHKCPALVKHEEELKQKSSLNLKDGRTNLET